MSRVYNFAAGPAMLPQEVLRAAAEEMLDYEGTGMSVLEMSHRSDSYQKIISSAEEDLRQLLKLPDNYYVLFLQGGATMQFSMVPMNFMSGGTADYIITGVWSQKAFDEAKKYGDVRIAASSKDRNFCYIPDCRRLVFRDNANYIHICENNTIYGTKYYELPDTDGKPLIADMSSCFLSEPIPIERYAMIYSGAQKNAGPAGVVIVVIRKDMLERDVMPGTPSMLQYKNHAENNSMFNTPPTYSIYICGKVLNWLKVNGGLIQARCRNMSKAKLLYDFLDGSQLFRGTADHNARSLMNITFVLPSQRLEEKFLDEAEKAGLLNLKGHRLAGGLRASIYNAMPLAGVEKLVDFMDCFEKNNF